MIVQTICQYCRHEFEADAEDRTAKCPVCNRETKISAQKISSPNKLESQLTSCPSCNAEVSTKADFCPKCGHRFRYAGGVNLKDPVHVIGLIICVIFSLAVIVGVVYYIIEVSH